MKNNVSTNLLINSNNLREKTINKSLGVSLLASTNNVSMTSDSPGGGVKKEILQ